MMKRHFRNTMLFALAIGLICSFALTGCSPAATSTPAATNTPVPTKGLEPVTLSWYILGGPQADQQLVMEEANKIIQSKINATLELNFVDGASYVEKMNLKISAGEDWDLCLTSNWGLDYVTNANKGAYLALDDLLPVYAKELTSYVMFTPNTAKATWDAIRINGKIYGIKYDTPMPAGSGFEGPKATFDAAGFDIKTVKKLADLEPFLAKVKTDMPTTTPLLTTAFQKILSSVLYMDTSNDGKYELQNPTLVFDTSDRKFKPVYDIPEFVGSCNTLRDFYNKGFIAKDAATVTVENADMKSYGVWFSSNVYGKATTTNGSAVSGVPCVEVQTVSPILKTSDCMGVITAINAKSKNPERAVMLANLVATDSELVNMLNWGLKDKHYTVTGQAADRPIVKPVPDSGYSPGCIWQIAPYSMIYAYDTYTYADIQDEVRARSEAKVSSMIGFIYVPDQDLKNQVAAVDATYAKYSPILLTGSADPTATLAKVKTELVQAGIEAIVADAQSQYDAWAAKK